MRSRGLHHVTTIIGDVNRSARFYAAILGLSRVKKTVCYDDPGSYHIYYGDPLGRPGTIISTLAWRCVPQGLVGVGEVCQTTFRIPEGSIGFWIERLTAANVPCMSDQSPFGEPMILLADPDGTSIALREATGTPLSSSVSTHAFPLVHGLQEVTLSMREADATIDILQDVFGFDRILQVDNCTRFIAHEGLGGSVTLRTIGPSSRGRLGGGTIRHVAFRATDENDLSDMADKLAKTYNISVTERIQRTYLTAIGFRAPCGILFEIATDGPGFAIDESPDRLGTGLALPPFLEERRPELQSILPSLP
ncbi:ring-cleaving dioxygenase [Bradyrhizobium sp. 2TAF24]|uniref:ring-cleaving dioxygenase n=1 Tax=Bradyrhizobium sp. 2TAF24 TaxID=3233011 RepID=UPI003F90C4FC